MATQRKMTRKTKSEVGYLAPAKEVRSDTYGFNQYQLTDTQKQFANRFSQKYGVLLRSSQFHLVQNKQPYHFLKFY